MMISRPRAEELLERFWFNMNHKIDYPHWIEDAVKFGMVPLEELIDGAYYYGDCRNTNVARWSATRQEFDYMRTKFNDRFISTIQHPEVDDGWDLFLPVGVIEPTEDEVIK